MNKLKQIIGTGIMASGLIGLVNEASAQVRCGDREEVLDIIQGPQFQEERYGIGVTLSGNGVIEFYVYRANLHEHLGRS